MCKDEKSNPVPSPWLTVVEGAKYLRMSKDVLYALVRGGTIPSYRRGKHTFVHTADLDMWMRSQPSGASPLSMVAGGSISQA